ncbi:MAG: hypothetical protein J8272_00270 ['Prunus persica' phytoplasma PP2]|nr:hypothetical protein ['Prunus persica' phytoplasma PP2]
MFPLTTVVYFIIVLYIYIYIYIYLCIYIYPTKFQTRLDHFPLKTTILSTYLCA